jgi:hypothetical protein
MRLLLTILLIFVQRLFQVVRSGITWSASSCMICVIKMFCLIIPLSERFAGLGGFLVAWATQYIIRWVEFICALFTANLLLSQNDNISLRGLGKACIDAHARLGVHDIDLDL